LKSNPFRFKETLQIKMALPAGNVIYHAIIACCIIFYTDWSIY